MLSGFGFGVAQLFSGLISDVGNKAYNTAKAWFVSEHKTAIVTEEVAIKVAWHVIENLHAKGDSGTLFSVSRTLQGGIVHGIAQGCVEFEHGGIDMILAVERSDKKGTSPPVCVSNKGGRISRSSFDSKVVALCRASEDAWMRRDGNIDIHCMFEDCFAHLGRYPPRSAESVILAKSARDLVWPDDGPFEAFWRQHEKMQLLPDRILPTIRGYFDGPGKINKRYNIPCRIGILIFGPPGTGKGSLAKVIVTELNWPLYIVSASSTVAELTSAISQVAAQSVILIEDFDEYVRAACEHSGEHFTAALSQALDGLTSPNETVLLATTNHPDAIPDFERLCRPGRFDCVSYIGYASEGMFQRMVETIVPRAWSRLKRFAKRIERLKIAPVRLMHILTSTLEVHKLVSSFEDLVKDSALEECEVSSDEDDVDSSDDFDHENNDDPTQARVDDDIQSVCESGGARRPDDDGLLIVRSTAENIWYKCSPFIRGHPWIAAGILAIVVYMCYILALGVLAFILEHWIAISMSVVVVLCISQQAFETNA